MSNDLAFSSITQITKQLRNGDLNPLNLVEMFEDRINRFEKHSKAFISLDLDNARHKAQTISYSEDKPLFGIPYACKDLFDVKSQVTTAGSKVLPNEPAQNNAVTIERMNAAGGIYLGKNNMHEFAYGATGENILYGTCPNPYDFNRLAGGSSSGSAAAVGFGLCAAALGTDTGGSVRAPAALCGLVGLKPTWDRVSTEGVIPYSWSLDHIGSITRTAADAGVLFSVLRDSVSPIKTVARKSLEGLTIGIPETFFFSQVDSEILDCIAGLMEFLTRSGANLRPVKMPSMEFTRSVSLTVQMPEALSYHNRYLEDRGDLYSQDFRAGLALGQCILAEQYVRAKRLIESYRRDTNEVFKQVDLLLTPATPTIAPEIGVTTIDIEELSEPAGNAITRFTSFFNMTGHPAITLPCGMHSKGLPICAQLVGRPYEDEVLIDNAIAIENSLEFAIPLPDFPRSMG